MPKLAQKTTLTDKFIQAIKNPPAGVQTTYWDDQIAGFGIRASSGNGRGRGARTFILMAAETAEDGRRKTVRHNCGSYPETTLKAAREHARAIREQLQAGTKASTIKADRKAAQGKEAASTVKAVAA